MWRGAQTAALREVWCEQMKKTRGQLPRSELLQKILSRPLFSMNQKFAVGLRRILALERPLERQSIAPSTPPAMSTTASTTQRCKVNLERLLRCCERLADEMRTESDRRRLLTYLSVLERYWHELDAARCNAAVLAEYRRKIEHIGDLLDDEKMLAGSGGALARSRLRNHTTLSREQANSELASRLNAASRVQQELRSQLMHHVEGAPPTTDEPASLPDGVEATRGGGAPRVATAAVATGPTTVATSTATAAVAAAASLGSGASIGGRAAARAADAREALLLPGGGAAAPLTLTPSPSPSPSPTLTPILTLSLTPTLTLP